MSNELTTRTGTPVHLQSEDVIVQAPFSYAGSTKRILRSLMPWARNQKHWTLTALAYTVVYTLIVLAWVGVTGWYLIFGLWLVPYRLIRRSDRSRERQRVQHQELMAATFAAAQAARPPEHE